MKFTVSRSIAFNVLSQLLKTCDVKAKGKPDSEFLFEERKGLLFVTATNDKCQQTIKLDTTSFKAETDEKFSANGQAIVDYIKLFQDDEIGCLYDSESNAFVMGSKLREDRFALPTPETIDYIPMKFLPQGGMISCEGPTLMEALRCTAFSAATEPRLCPKTAVKLTINNDKLTADSMDDYRLSRYSVVIPDQNDKMELLLPRETAEILSHLLADVSEVMLTAGTSHLKCEWDDTVLVARLEANTTGVPYPDFSKVFNKPETARIKASRGEIQRSLKVAGLVAKDSTIELSAESIGLVISSDESNTGATKNVVVADEQEGEAETLVAWKYMSKGVDMTVSPWIELSFTEMSNGLQAVTIIDNNFSHMVLPVIPNQVKVDDKDSEVESEDGNESEE